MKKLINEEMVMPNNFGARLPVMYAQYDIDYRNLDEVANMLNSWGYDIKRNEIVDGKCGRIGYDVKNKTWAISPGFGGGGQHSPNWDTSSRGYYITLSKGGRNILILFMKNNSFEDKYKDNLQQFMKTTFKPFINKSQQQHSFAASIDPQFNDFEYYLELCQKKKKKKISKKIKIK